MIPFTISDLSSFPFSIVRYYYTLTTNFSGKLGYDVVKICYCRITPVVIDVDRVRGIGRKERVRTHWNPALGRLGPENRGRGSLVHWYLGLVVREHWCFGIVGCGKHGGLVIIIVPRCGVLIHGDKSSITVPRVMVALPIYVDTSRKTLPQVTYQQCWFNGFRVFLESFLKAPPVDEFAFSFIWNQNQQLSFTSTLFTLVHLSIRGCAQSVSYTFDLTPL